MLTLAGRSLIRRLLPDAFWTLVNSVLSVLGSLAVVKIVSLLVPAEDYGGANLVLGIVALLTLFIVNPVLTAQLRIFFDHARPGTAASFERAVEPLLLRCAGLMAASYLVVAAAYGLARQGVYFQLAVPALLLCLLTPHVNATLNFMEGRRQYRLLAAGQMVLRLAPALFLAILVLSSLSRSSIIVLAQGLSFALVFALFRRSALSERKPIGSGSAPMEEPAAGPPRAAADLSGSSTFGWSLYFYNAAYWAMGTSDRYLIDFFWSSREVGLYAINYGFCGMPYLMLSGWIETFTRSRLYGRAAAGDRAGIRAIMRGRLLLAAGGCLFGTVAMYFLAEPIGLLLLGTRYWQGRRLAMVLCAAYAFQVMGSIYHSLFIAAKRADVLSRTTCLSAALNVLLNLYLVPRLGIQGAGLSILASFIVWFLVLTVCAWRLLGRGTAGVEVPPAA